MFPSQCNVVIHYVLVLEGKLLGTSFTSLCNIVVGNAQVLDFLHRDQVFDGNVVLRDFVHYVMYLMGMWCYEISFTM